jgi:undecaprenyl diphosphate synthase
MTEAIPEHLAFILDGNRRWAKQRGLPTLLGHQKGYRVLKKIVDASFERGVKYVSAFVFSTENWSRASEEVDYLMDLALRIFTKDLKETHEKGIRICWFGIKDKLSQKHINAIAEAEELTKNNTAGTLCICFNYGGKQEIIDATKKIVASGISVDEITDEDVEKNLYHPEVPAVDLMVRTSNEHRISNFLLWRLAYSEFLFIKKHWPSFGVKDLDKVLEEYASRSRRFGK